MGEFKFDDKVKLLKLDKDFSLDKGNHDFLKSFLEDNFSKVGKIVYSHTGSFALQSIKFNVGNSYCCLNYMRGCLFIRKIEIPEEKRGNGFLREFLPRLEEFLSTLGFTSVCFENIQNGELLQFLLKSGYSKAYFNFPIPENEDEFDMPEAYKILDCIEI